MLVSSVKIVKFMDKNWNGCQLLFRFHSFFKQIKIVTVDFMHSLLKRSSYQFQMKLTESSGNIVGFIDFLFFFFFSWSIIEFPAKLNFFI